MKKLSILLAGTLMGLFVLFSFVSASEGNIVWTGSGDQTQTISLIKNTKDGKPANKLLYKFKNVRFTTMIDTGSFTLYKQSEVNQFIADLNGAISKVSDETKTEYSRKKYTVSVGGNSSKVKNNFWIEVGDKFCPIHKKDAKKLIKVLEPEIKGFSKD